MDDLDAMMMHHAMMMHKFKESLIVALIQRLTVDGKFTIPIQELDEIGGVTLEMTTNDADRTFVFTIAQTNHANTH